MTESNASSKVQIVVGWALLAVGIIVFAVRLQHEGAYAMPRGGNLFGGLGALLTGRVLDRVGSGPVMLVTLLAGSALLLVAAGAQSQTAFILSWGFGAGIISAVLESWRASSPMWKSIPNGSATSSRKYVPRLFPLMRRTTSPTRYPKVSA